MKIAAAAKALLLLQVVADAAFVPCSVERVQRKGNFMPLISMAASINKKKRDPFLNTPMRNVGDTNGRKQEEEEEEVNSSSEDFITSRFERFDKKKYGKQLQDTRLDDFINRYSKTSREHAATSEGGASINDFEDSKFHRYDKKKDGNLLLDRDGGKRVDPNPMVDEAEDLVLERWKPKKRSGVNGTNDIALENFDYEGPLDHEQERKRSNDVMRYQNSTTIPSSRRDSGQKLKYPTAATKRARVRDQDATIRGTRSAARAGRQEGEQNKGSYRRPETQNLGIPTLYDSWSDDRIKSSANRMKKPTSDAAGGATRSRNERMNKPIGDFSIPSSEHAKTAFSIPKKPRGPSNQSLSAREPSPPSKSSTSPPPSSQFNPPASSHAKKGRVYQSRPPEGNFRQQPSPLLGEKFPPRKQQSQSHQPTARSKGPSTVVFPSTLGNEAPRRTSTTEAPDELKVSANAGTDLIQDLFESTLKDTKANHPSDSLRPESQRHRRKATPEDEMQDILESNMMEMMGAAPKTEIDPNNIPYPRRSGGWDGWDDIPPVPTQKGVDASGPSPIANNADDEDKILALQRQIEELKAMVTMSSTSQEEATMDELEAPKFTIKDYSHKNAHKKEQAELAANDNEYIDDMHGYENLMLEQLLHQEGVESNCEMDSSSYFPDDEYSDRGDNSRTKRSGQDGFEEKELEYIREAVVYENLSPNQSYHGPVQSSQGRKRIQSHDACSDHRQQERIAREYIHEVQGPRQQGPTPKKRHQRPRRGPRQDPRQRPRPETREWIASEDPKESDVDDSVEGDDDAKPKPRSPGFVGFSDIDWSKGR